MRKSDSDLQRDVQEELEWEPRVDHADIGVSVTDGVVSLNGYVKTYAEKIAAERAAMRVEGVKAVADEVKVRFASDSKLADHKIAKRILDLFRYNILVPETGIQVDGSTDAVFSPHAGSFQCAISSGMGLVASMVRVTPPKIASAKGRSP
jgi:hypothetical protein